MFGTPVFKKMLKRWWITVNWGGQPSPVPVLRCDQLRRLDPVRYPRGFPSALAHTIVHERRLAKSGWRRSVRARHAPACNSPVKRTLGIRSGRDLGMNSLVFSSGLDICVIVSRIAIFDAAIIAQRKN